MACTRIIWLPDEVEPPAGVAFGAPEWPFVADADEQALLVEAARVLARPGVHPVLRSALIVGPHGSGKSCLIRAILRPLRKAYGPEKLGLRSGRDFRRAVRQAQTTRRLDAFLQPFEDAAVIVVDGIEELVDGRTTQHALEQLIDHADQRGTRLILASCERPAQVPGMSDRLCSRLSDRLVVELPAVPPRPVRRWLVNRWLAEATGSDQPAAPSPTEREELVEQWEALQLPMPAARALVHQLRPSGERRARSTAAVRPGAAERPARTDIALEAVAAAVARHFGTTVRELRGKSRSRSVVRARHVAFHLGQKLAGASSRELGAYFGRRDHSTVLHAQRSLARRCDTDPQLREIVDRITAELTRDRLVVEPS